MNEQIKKSILRTISYSDIFDYPLNKTEIWKFLISSEKVSKENFDRVLIASSLRVLHHRTKQSTDVKGIATLSRKAGFLAMTEENDFYFLPDRAEIISKRLKRERESKRKFKIAQKAASFLSIIPTIYLIGLSGSLAMNNSDKDDDIDFFIIVKKNSIWTTRLLSLFILQILGKRRKRKDIKVKNKICINMIIDESILKMPKDRQNLYTAHEVAQMRPVFDRKDTYQKFIAANKWVRRFLPNSLDTKILRYKDTGRKNKKSLNIFFPALEYLAKKIQLWSINRHQTIETVDDHLLAFHPIDYGDLVMKEYNKRLKKYKIND